MPKKIFYCVDFHCPAGGAFGYDDGEVEDESEELNESIVRFCDRLIRG